jgi:dynein heavy chain
VNKTDIDEAPDVGVYIQGLFLEGASWNKELSILDEPIPNQIYENLPIVIYKILF